jgi:hypothetical protein
MKRSAFAIALLLLAALQLNAFADPIPDGGVAQNVTVVGYSNLDDRPGFKMSIVETNGRWYLYLGHLWHFGWTIVDVTEPSDPKVLKFIPGPTNTWTIQMEISGNTMITALEQIAEGWGGDPSKPYDEGVLIWDIGDRLNPKQLGQFKTGSTGTHRNWYSGGKYMHLAAEMPGFKNHIYVIVDISDPAHPAEVGRWWVKGQRDGETPPAPPGTILHGPPFVVGDKVFLSYGGAGMYILDISDVAHPKEVGHLSYSPPFIPFIGVHTVVPVPERNIAIVNSEAIRENCQEPLNQASIVDIADLSKPRLIAMLPLPLPPPGAPYKSFCEKGGRFGPHNQNNLLHNPYVQKQGDLVYLTYFNAGLRIYNIASPTAPREVGYFVPPDPKRRFGTFPQNKLVAQTEDVLVDSRGYIYITDKNQGLFILKYTGQ